MTLLTFFHWRRILITYMAMSFTILKLPVFETGRYWYTTMHFINWLHIRKNGPIVKYFDFFDQLHGPTAISYDTSTCDEISAYFSRLWIDNEQVDNNLPLGRHNDPQELNRLWHKMQFEAHDLGYNTDYYQCDSFKSNMTTNTVKKYNKWHTFYQMLVVEINVP